MTSSRTNSYRCAKKIRRAKRTARSELSVSKGEWSKHGYADSTHLLSTSHLNDTLPRIDARSITLEEFIERFEKPRLPVVLTHLCDDWAAVKDRKWTADELMKRYANHKFKIGSDDDGYAGTNINNKQCFTFHRIEGTMNVG